MSQEFDRVRWRSMASAPQDGTRVLVTVRASEQGEASVDTAYWARSARTAEAGWRAADSHPDCVIAYQEGELMGWAPLPSPDGAPAPLPTPMRPDEIAESGGSGI